MSEWLRKEQDEINTADKAEAGVQRRNLKNRIKELEDVVRKICTITDDIHESLEHILERLHALEEKERLRAMLAHDEHERDVR